MASLMARSIAKEIVNVIPEMLSKIQTIDKPKPTAVPIPEPTIAPPKNRSRGRKRKNRNFTMVSSQNPPFQPQHTTAQNLKPTKRPYIGLYPKCPTCNYHHLATTPCRICTTCSRYGHLSQYCRSGFPSRGNQAQAQSSNQNSRPQSYPGRACFKCNDPNHLINQCPQRSNQGPPQQASHGHEIINSTAQAQDDNNVAIGCLNK